MIESGRNYGSYIVGIHVRASFLALLLVNCHAWTMSGHT